MTLYIEAVKPAERYRAHPGPFPREFVVWDTRIGRPAHAPTFRREPEAIAKADCYNREWSAWRNSAAAQQ